MQNEKSNRLSDYDRLSEEEWSDAVQSHVINIDRVVGDAVRKAIREYVVTVFAGAWGKELTFVGEVIDNYRQHFSEKDLAEDLERHKLFGPTRTQ